jgi:PAS domain S-box-containing protein
MSDPMFHHLQALAESACRSQTLQEGIDHLAQAFSLFSHETFRLEEAYSKLQNRFKAVNIQLEESHRKLQEKLMQLDLISHYLDNILRHINQGILFIGLEGLITTYNQASEKILEMPHKKVIFQPYSEFFRDDLFGFSMTRALQNLSAPPFSYAVIDQENEKELEISTSFVSKGSKSNQGIIVLLRDITEMRRLQKQAILSNRMKELGEMAASLAHEIRNPLGGIQGYASLLQRDLEGKEHLQNMAGYIIEGTKTLGHLLDNVLNYARPLHLEIETIEMVSFLREIISFIQADLSFSHKIKIEVECKEDSLNLRGDRQRLRSALLNLIYNAIQAMPKGGVVIVSSSREKENLLIAISDTGIGIAPQYIDKIFSPFFTTKATGTGLGLCETYKIVQAHFGTIHVRSQPEKGSVFTITLPLRG